MFPAYAATHSREEVANLISQAQTTLTSIRNGASSEVIRSEISRIDDACSRSQKLLSEGKIDDAYNEISLGMLYFQMIDARIDLQKALVELDDAKKNISQ
jgi:hypothetical protein